MVLVSVEVALAGVLGQPLAETGHLKTSPLTTSPETQAEGRTKPQEHKPPVLHALPEFSLTDHLSQPFGTHQLLGKAWIANFILTRGSSAASQTAGLADLQRELKRRPGWTDIRIITFTLDPEHDTLEVLREYAAEVGADEGHWRFLTGPREQLWQLSERGFQLSVEGDAGDPDTIAHSRKLVLVDPQGHVRGFYDPESGNNERR